MIAPQTKIFQAIFDTIINFTPIKFYVKTVIIYAFCTMPKLYTLPSNTYYREDTVSWLGVFYYPQDYWGSDQLYPAGYENWIPSSADPTNGSSSLECGQANFGTDGLWHRVDCYTPAESFICEAWQGGLWLTFHSCRLGVEGLLLILSSNRRHWDIVLWNISINQLKSTFYAPFQY